MSCCGDRVLICYDGTGEETCAQGICFNQENGAASAQQSSLLDHFYNRCNKCEGQVLVL